MNMTRLAVQRPITTLMVSLFVVLLGVLSLRDLSVDLLPDLDAVVRPTISAAATDAGPLVERIANELTAAPPATLVIDDYHLIGNPQIDDALERLIELAPDTFLLILGTRVDPGMRLSRLRVRSQLVEIRADQLGFDAREAHELLTLA